MIRILLFSLFACSAFSHAGVDESRVVRSYLCYLYGKDVPEIRDICIPCEDLWMLRGRENIARQVQVLSSPAKASRTGLFMEMIDGDLCIVELKDGKVDPGFNLENVYATQRGLVLQLVYHSLRQDKRSLARLVTHPDNVSFGGAPAASDGDMDVYVGVLEHLPVSRTGSPTEDAKTKSVEYRIPMGDKIFSVRVVRAEGEWKIDTSKPVEVPLGFFFR